MKSMKKLCQLSIMFKLLDGFIRGMRVTYKEPSFMMLIGQNEITSNRVCNGSVCLCKRCLCMSLASVTRHLILHIFMTVMYLYGYMGCNENYKALSNPSHISQFYAILKVLSNHKSTNNK